VKCSTHIVLNFCCPEYWKVETKEEELLNNDDTATVAAAAAVT